jgi:hypothetical protein
LETVFYFGKSIFGNTQTLVRTSEPSVGNHHTANMPSQRIFSVKDLQDARDREQLALHCWDVARESMAQATAQRKFIEKSVAEQLIDNALSIVINEDKKARKREERRLKDDAKRLKLQTPDLVGWDFTRCLELPPVVTQPTSDPHCTCQLDQVPCHFCCMEINPTNLPASTLLRLPF